jgi:hypothetical protein
MSSVNVKHKIEWVIGAALFIGFILTHLIFGIAPAVKVLGASCIFTGVLWMYRRTIAVGIEGRVPSHYIRGLLAIFLGVAMVVIGIVMWRYSLHVACLLGWSNDKDCP